MSCINFVKTVALVLLICGVGSLPPAQASGECTCPKGWTEHLYESSWITLQKGTLYTAEATTNTTSRYVAAIVSADDQERVVWTGTGTYHNIMELDYYKDRGKPSKTLRDKLLVYFIQRTIRNIWWEPAPDRV